MIGSEPEVATPDLLDRAAGCLVGAALGDAFGMPLEFNPPPRLQVREFTSGPLPAGSLTDDTEMMLALAGTLLAHGQVDSADLASRFVDWFDKQPRDVGIHTGSVLSLIQRGVAWDDAVVQIQARNPTSAGNGSVMRCFPVALTFWDDLPACIEQSRLQSRVTHPNQECQDACAFVNAVIWHALHGADAQGAVELALADLPTLTPDLRSAILEAKALNAGDLRNTGWVRHTVRNAVWGVLTTDNHVDAVIKTANLGDDADTVAAVAGAMAGAIHGLSSIPQDWQQILSGEWPIHSGSVWGAAELQRLAHALISPTRLALELIPKLAPGPENAPASTAQSVGQAIEQQMRGPQKSQYRGALLGGAIGDALGLPFEGGGGNSRRADFGWIAGYNRFHQSPARFSDDTQHTIIVAECLIANGWLNPRDLAKRLVAWLPKAIGEGESTKDAVKRIASGVAWYAAANYERSGGNAGAMRSAPVGLLRWREPVRLVAEAELSCVPTHSQPVAVAGAIAMAAATAWLLTHKPGTWTPKQFVAAVQSAIANVEAQPIAERKPSGSVTTLYKRVGQLPDLISLAPEEFFSRYYSGAFVLESVPAAFYCFLRDPSNFESAVLSAVNYARDADTVGAMVGTLIGAALGDSALPDRLLNNLDGRELLVSLADQLWELAAPKSRPADRSVEDDDGDEAGDDRTNEPAVETITKTAISQVLRFLPLFEDRDRKLYSEDGSLFDPLPWSAELSEFVQALYDTGFVIPFDWTSWSETAQRYMQNPQLLATADLETVRKLFTSHVRTDRFAAGHLATMVGQGHILALLHRLEVLSVRAT